jgi:hypothetical protein
MKECMTTVSDDRQLWANATNRLKKKCALNGTPCTISLEQVLALVQPTCQLTGMPLIRNVNNNAAAPALMLLDKAAGYVPGNVMVVSNLAATLRHTLADSELVIMCRRIIKMVETDKLIG